MFEAWENASQEGEKPADETFAFVVRWQPRPLVVRDQYNQIGSLTRADPDENRFGYLVMGSCQISEMTSRTKP